MTDLTGTRSDIRCKRRPSAPTSSGTQGVGCVRPGRSPRGRWSRSGPAGGGAGTCRGGSVACHGRDSPVTQPSSAHSPVSCRLVI